MLTFTEIEGNVLNAPKDVFIAHCISSDFKLGAGVAKQIDQRFGTRRELLKKFPYGCAEDFKSGKNLCIPTPRVLNLVTKEKYFQKPTYKIMSDALTALYNVCMDNHIHKLAIPKIGCGLDGLNWELVKDIIKEIFNDRNSIKFEITAYILGE